MVEKSTGANIGWEKLAGTVALFTSAEPDRGKKEKLMKIMKLGLPKFKPCSHNNESFQ